MSSNYDGKPAMDYWQAATHTIINEFREFICKTQLTQFRYLSKTARHFLIWMQINAIELETVDGTVIGRFLQHQCNCYDVSSEPDRQCLWRPRDGCIQLLWFVRFLEQTGRVRTPGDLQDNVALVHDFVEQLRLQGYSAKTIAKYRAAAFSLISWLHFFRVRLCDLTPEGLAHYRERQFTCSMPGLFVAQSSRFSKYHEYHLARFLEHLVRIGQLKAFEPVAPDNTQPAILKQFCEWLEQYRGIRRNTISNYASLVAAVLPVIGEDPNQYDAAIIDEAAWQQLQGRSASYAKSFVKALRMYLRFLVLQGLVSATLITAVPKVPSPRLANLPRYISDHDVERAIASCPESTDTGVRDRAILLLLARLALRGGDIVALRLGDIDWDRGQILVTGKSHRTAVLPLPQDAGDALHAYIAKHRPNVDVEQVFVATKAPHRPFASSARVSRIACLALDRAEIVTFASRGAHVFRHSRATNLLRSGSPLDAIQSLLRHASADTTMIYAKTDTTMLREIAQPWVGGGQS